MLLRISLVILDKSGKFLLLLFSFGDPYFKKELLRDLSDGMSKTNCKLG